MLNRNDRDYATKREYSAFVTEYSHSLHASEMGDPEDWNPINTIGARNVTPGRQEWIPIKQQHPRPGGPYNPTNNPDEIWIG